MFSRFFSQKELQLIQLRRKHRPPQIVFTTVAPDNQIKLLHYLIKYETVLLSQNDDCHPSYLTLETINSPFNGQGENIEIKPLDSLFFGLVRTFQDQYK